MNIDIKYPIKYAVLKLKEQGGYLVGYKDITRGYIVSKCYVMESNIKYNQDGTKCVYHKVVFPYNDIGRFKTSLKNGGLNIGTEEIPNYDASGKPFSASIVNNLYETYEAAKELAEEKNKEHRDSLTSKTPAPVTAALAKTSWQEQYNNLREEFEVELEICKYFEQLVLEATKDMKISKDKSRKKPKQLQKTYKELSE